MNVTATLTREQAALTSADRRMLRDLSRGVAQTSVAIDMGIPHARLRARLRELRVAYGVTGGTSELLGLPAIKEALGRGPGRPPKAPIDALTPVHRDDTEFNDTELIILTGLRAGASQRAINDAQGWPRHMTWYTLKLLRRRYRVETTGELLGLPVVRAAVRRTGGR